MTYVNCCLCGSKEHKPFKEIDGSRLVKCRRCGLVYLNRRPNRREVGEKYSAGYHIERLLGHEPVTEEEIEKEINKNAGRAEEIISECGHGGKLLDIGCGAGFFIACLKKHGWDVTGIDFSEWASGFARDRLGLNVFKGTIEDIKLDESFNVITMYHVLEHLPDPLTDLKKISEVLADDGVLVVKGPNLASFDRLWHGENWRGFTDRTHLYYFTPETYKRILEKADFSVEKMAFQHWDPVAHLMEVKLGDGIRADHPSDTVGESMKRRERDNLICRAAGKAVRVMSRLLDLKGRDVTIYAKKREGL